MNRKGRSSSRPPIREGLSQGSFSPYSNGTVQLDDGRLRSSLSRGGAGRLRGPSSHQGLRPASPYLDTFKLQSQAREPLSLRTLLHSAKKGTTRQPGTSIDRRPNTAPTVSAQQPEQKSTLDDASCSSGSQHDEAAPLESEYTGWEEEGASEALTRSASQVEVGWGLRPSMPMQHRHPFLMKSQVVGMPSTIVCCGTTEDKLRKGHTCLYKATPLVKFGGIANRAIRAAFLEAGFRETTGSEWNVLWGSFVKKGNYRRLQPWQKCNHWPGTWELGRKDLFYKNIDKLQRRHGKICLLPKFFILPNSWEEFMQYLKHNPNKMWIRKPLASSRGRGIRVLSKPGKISPTCNKCILQEYIQRPLCVHGFKFDMRIYVAITSFHPMRAYVFQNGLVRFASLKYEKGKVKQRRMHLTNVKLNKGHVRDGGQELFDDGKWSLSQLWSYIRAQNLGDPVRLWRQIRILAALALLAAEPKMSSQVMCCAASNTCFEIFGMDILLDHKCRAKILEVNTCPSLGCSPSCAVDKAVKYPMLAELLHLVGPVLAQQAISNPARSSEIGSRSEHVRKWRDCQPAFGRTPARDLPYEVQSSEAEWQRLGDSSWQVLLPGVDGDDQVDSVYSDCHWTHHLLARWLRYREPEGHTFKTGPGEEAPGL